MFAHLHTHSYYSLLEGLSSPKDLAMRAKELGCPALGLTDKTSMHGCIDFYKACKEVDIKPVIGTEVYVAETSRFDTSQKTGTKKHNLILLATSHLGYENLLQITTKSHIEGFYYKPRVDKELLKEYSKDLIALSSDHYGEIAQAVLMGKSDEEILKIIQGFQDIFGKERFFLELMDHPEISGRNTINQKFIEIGKSQNVPLIVSNNAHYARKDDMEAHEVILCLQTGKDFHDPSRFSMREGDYSLKPYEEIKEAFPDQEQAFTNTLDIANQCSYNFVFGKNLIPSFEIPKSETETNDQYIYFRKLCYQGLLTRYPELPLKQEDISILIALKNIPTLGKEITQITTDELKEYAEKTFTDEKQKLLKKLTTEQRVIIDRLEYEMCAINEMGFYTYFLIVHDFVYWARQHDIAVGPGRGSAAGALISYCLTITDIDPLTYNLLFERFLNPARVSMPDIDLDFEDVRRGEVLEYVIEKYGKYNVANVATFGTMKARQAVKDVGRALGIPYQEMDKVVKLITEKLGTKLKTIMESNPDIKEIIANNEQLKKVFTLGLKIEGVVRQLGVHACAVIISEKPLTVYTALQYPPKDKTSFVTQYSAKPLEMLGLLKMDFLGLRNLTVLQLAVNIIEKKRDIKIDMSLLPLDDQKTFDLFSRGETKGVFQFESDGMRKWLKELKPDNIEDIIAMAAMYRPGPLAWIPVYVGNKHKTKVTFPTDEGKKNFESLIGLLEKYPKVKKILEPSNLIPIYQEQILQIAQEFSGFSLGEADLLRRAIGKKIAEELMAQKQKFIDGAVNLGRSKEDAVFLFERGIEPFADYGFNKSHAACYAIIAYRTAYLKAHYPTEFMTALLTTVEDSTDKLIVWLEDCQNMNITILPPDINESDVHFTAIREGAIRFGLNAIKGLGIEVAKEIVRYRESAGNFNNLEDFVKRIPNNVLNKKTLEALAYGGAFDRFNMPRDTITKNTDIISMYAKEYAKNASSGQIDLFGDSIDSSLAHRLVLENPSPDSHLALLKKEKTVLGFYVSSHPLLGITKYIKTGAKLIGELSPKDVGRKVTLVCLIATIKKLMTKKGEMMAFLKLEDISSEIEGIIFPKTYVETSPFLIEDSLVKVRGKLELRDGAGQILIEEIKPLSLETMSDNAKKLELFDEQEKKIFMKNSLVDEPEKHEEMIIIELPSQDQSLLATLKQELESLKNGHTNIKLKIGDTIITTPYKKEVSENILKKYTSTIEIANSLPQ